MYVDDGHGVVFQVFNDKNWWLSRMVFQQFKFRLQSGILHSYEKSLYLIRSRANEFQFLKAKQRQFWDPPLVVYHVRQQIKQTAHVLNFLSPE